MAGRTKLPTGVYPSGASHYQYRLVRRSWWEERTDPVTGAPKRVRRQDIEVRGGFLTPEDAWEARQRRARELGRGAPVTRHDATVADALDERIRAAIVEQRAPNTIGLYRDLQRLYIAPHLGGHLLRDLAPGHLRGWLTTLTEQGLAVRTIRSAWVLLSSALMQAMADGLTDRNVALLVKLPRAAKHRPRVWTNEEIARFLSHARDDALAAHWWLALLLQLRPGELAGLQWGDIDWRAGTLTIARTRTRDVERREVLGSTTKTPGSAATLPLPASCIELLRRHRSVQAAQRLGYPGHWHDFDLIFPADDGRMVSGETINAKLRRLCERAGVPRLKPHELRHTGATWMARMGESPKTISQRLRHASVAMTLDLYVSGDDDAQLVASDRLDRAATRRADAG